MFPHMFSASEVSVWPCAEAEGHASTYLPTDTPSVEQAVRSWNKKSAETSRSKQFSSGFLISAGSQ